MYSLNHATDPVQAVIARPPDHLVASDQALDAATQVATMDCTVLGLDIGVLAKPADDQAILGGAQQTVIDFRGLFF